MPYTCLAIKHTCGRTCENGSQLKQCQMQAPHMPCSERCIQRAVETTPTIHVLTVLTLRRALDIMQVCRAVILALRTVKGTKAHQLHKHSILGHIVGQKELTLLVV